MALKTLTVVIPALNEGENLRAAVLSVSTAAARHFSDFEIIIVNDGSRDQTGKIADELARQSDQIRVIHHAAPKNLGFCYKAALQQAQMNYFVLIPGDNEYSLAMIESLFTHVGEADLIIPYPPNPEVRPWFRQFLSAAFVSIINGITGFRLRYYNGIVVSRTFQARRITIRTDGFGYMAEAIVNWLRDGLTYLEVPVAIQYRPRGRSKAFRANNLFEVFCFLCRLGWSSVPNLKIKKEMFLKHHV